MPEPSRSVRIRTATPGDAAPLARFRAVLFRELGRASDDEAGPAFEERCRAALAAQLESGTAAAWIAEDAGGEPVGTVVLLVFPRLPTPRNPRTAEGYVVGVYVLPERRGEGIGTELLRVAVDGARECGLARIRLHATASGARVYGTLGFRRRDDEMELDLCEAPA